MNLIIEVESTVGLTITPELQAERDFLQDIKDALILPNPEYTRRLRLGKSTYGVPEIIRLYEFERQSMRLTMPRGMLGMLLRGLQDRGIAYRIIDQRSGGRTWIPLSEIELRPYQAPVIGEAWASQGVVIAPCGSGKTIMGLAMAARSRSWTLWITHTRELARQVAGRARELLGLSEVGMIGSGAEKIRPFTVALVQTLSRRDISEWIRAFGCVIVDEAHHVPAATFTEILSRIPAMFRFGLTATPDRADGLGPAIFRTIGPKIFEISSDQLCSAGQVIIPALVQVRTGFLARPDDYAAYISAASNDDRRNALIISTVAPEARAGRRCLVLTERIDHCRRLADSLRVLGIEAAALTGTCSAEERQAAIHLAGSSGVVVATRLADEGLDLPELDRLFLAFPSRSEARLRQQIGRIMRPAAGKSSAIVYAFVDQGIRSTALRRVARQFGLEELGLEEVSHVS